MTWIVALTTIAIAILGTNGDVSIVEPESGSMVAQLGSTVNLICENPDGGEVEWVADSVFGELIISDGPPFILTTEEGSSGYRLHLAIEGTTEEDATDYTCRSKDDPSDSQVMTLTLVPKGEAPPADWVAPKIDLREGQDTVEVEVNKELRLRCSGGSKDSDLEILHNGDVIMEDTHSFMTDAQDVVMNQKVVILTRHPALTEYSGEYTCRDVDYLLPEDSVQVDVIEHPSARVEIIEPSGMQTKVTTGDNFILKCQSSIQTTVVWYQGDNQIENEQNGFIIGDSEDTQSHMRTSVLTKEGAELADAGKYRCVNADSPDEEASIEVAVKNEGDDDDGDLFDGLLSGVPSVMSSVLIIFLAALSALL